MLVLAPMYDVTDTVFRQIVVGCAPPDLLMTEFVNVDGLCSSGASRLKPYLYREPTDVPLVAQIWGQKPANYFQVAQDLVAAGFSGVDINMGCPDRQITKRGSCSALARPENRQLAAEIIAAVKDGVAGRLPVSVKTRLGWSASDWSWPEFLFDQEIDSLTIHGRTTKEMSRVPARWGEIAQVRQIRDQKQVATKVIGNGDIGSRAQALDYQQRYRLDGIMIGRAIFRNPYLFDPNPDIWSATNPLSRLELYDRHLALFATSYPAGERRFAPLKKFMKVYLTGWPGASDLRQRFAGTESARQARQLLAEYKAERPDLAELEIITATGPSGQGQN